MGDQCARPSTTAAKRLYLLSDEPWPRSAKIEVVGIEVLRTAAPGEEAPRSITIPFENGVVKVAKGSNVSLKVAAAWRPRPRSCRSNAPSITARSKRPTASRGERGSVTMSNFRDTSDWRNFWFDNKPFKGVLSTIEFDVVGYDHRVSGYRLEVVDSPAVVETLLDLTYPPYMVDEATSSHLPVTDQPYLPAGHVHSRWARRSRCKFKSNKPLQQAEIVASDTRRARRRSTFPPAQPTARAFRLSRFDALTGSVTLEVSLLDADNVATERPYRVFLTAIEDQPPQVEVAPEGHRQRGDARRGDSRSRQNQRRLWRRRNLVRRPSQ